MIDVANFFHSKFQEELHFANNLKRVTVSVAKYLVEILPTSFMRGALYKYATLLFLTVSITWGVLKMIAEFNPKLSFFMDMSPLGMMISFIALVSSYSEASNSKEMEYKYGQMSDGTISLRKESSDVKNDSSLDEWIKRCETFLRTQNNEWSLKREDR